MRIQVLSDLHMEFFQNAAAGKRFIDSLNPGQVDVLVLAGDIGTTSNLEQTLRRFCAKYEQVVYVPGNHEYWGSSLAKTTGLLHDLADKLPNLHWLSRGSIVLKGQRFIGCTMWFPYDPLNVMYRKMMNDFSQISGFEGWVYEENSGDVEFLRSQLLPTDVVVTHHLPSHDSVAPRFRGSSINRFFVCDMQDLIQGVQPKAWIHGHTHDSFDYRIGDTRVVCNPFGYKDHDENRGFLPALVIDTGV